MFYNFYMKFSKSGGYLTLIAHLQFGPVTFQVLNSQRAGGPYSGELRCRSRALSVIGCRNSI